MGYPDFSLFYCYSANLSYLDQVTNDVLPSYSTYYVCYFYITIHMFTCVYVYLAV